MIFSSAVFLFVFFPITLILYFMPGFSGNEEKEISRMSRKEREELIERLTREMKAAAKILEFEHAAALRDRIEKLRQGK